MGMFDTVHFECPKCGNKMDTQSKGGPCELKNYSADNVPLGVAADITGMQQWCNECRHTFALVIPGLNSRVAMTTRPWTEPNPDEEYD
jgi:hypothetical protein